MKQQHWLILSAGVTILGAVGFLAVAGRKRKRDAATFLRKLAVLLNPKTTGLLAQKAFDIHYFKNLINQVPGQLLLIKDEVALNAANQIKDAWGFFYTSDDDLKKITGIITSLNDQAAVSKMASAYLDRTGVNLIDEIQSRLSENQIKMILRTVENLKPYQTRQL